MVERELLIVQTLFFTVPEGVLAPILTAVSSSEIQVNWALPQSPNGIILNYNLYIMTVEDGERLVATLSAVDSFTVGSLEPFNEYVFFVEACTSVGCNRSEMASAVTLESGELNYKRWVRSVLATELWPVLGCSKIMVSFAH